MIDQEFEKFSSLEFAFSHLEDFTAAMAPKHSYLLVKDCPGELYISDNPMVMHNNKDYGPYGNIGLAVPHIEIYYQIVLAYMCPPNCEGDRSSTSRSGKANRFVF